MQIHLQLPEVLSRMKKLVVRVSVSAGERSRFSCKSIFIKLAKIMVPCGFLRKMSTPTSADNKSKVMKIAVSLPGVQGVGLEGDDKLVVKGNDELDPVDLLNKLRKKIPPADIVSLEKEKEQKEKKEEEEKKVICGYPYCSVPMSYMEISEPPHPCVIQ